MSGSRLRFTGAEPESTLQGGLGLCADSVGDGLAIAVQGDERDTLYPGRLREMGLLVDVDLGDLQLAAAIGGDLVDDRRQLTARSTPRRPVVHKDGSV